MKIRVLLLGIAFALVSNFAWAGCGFTNVTEVEQAIESGSIVSTLGKLLQML